MIRLQPGAGEMVRVGIEAKSDDIPYFGTKRSR